MKILSKPDYDNWSQEVDCSQCLSKIQFDITDVTSYKRKIYETGNVSDAKLVAREIDAFAVSCPICDNKINVKLPYLLEVKAKENKSS
jgi:hypothetical protein